MIKATSPGRAEFRVLLATSTASLPRAPTGAFHAASSELSHSRARESRHCPEATLLYRTIQEHWATFLEDLESGGGELPAFVLDEFEAYLRCGIRVHGFLRVRCKDCGYSRVVAFACKRRGFCPSCLGRRMADTAAFCADRLFPRVPARQYVLSLPYALRFKLAYSADTTSVVLGAFISAINSDLRRRAGKRKLRGRLQTGSLTVVQRFGSSLNLNVHFHVIAMDGVYAGAGPWSVDARRGRSG